MFVVPFCRHNGHDAKVFILFQFMQGREEELKEKRRGQLRGKEREGENNLLNISKILTHL